MRCWVGPCHVSLTGAGRGWLCAWRSGEKSFAEFDGQLNVDDNWMPSASHIFAGKCGNSRLQNEHVEVELVSLHCCTVHFAHRKVFTRVFDSSVVEICSRCWKLTAIENNVTPRVTWDPLLTSVHFYGCFIKNRNNSERSISPTR